MSTPSDFWLAVQALEEAYDAEGLAKHERLESIVAKFHKLGPLVRRSLLADARRMAISLSDIYTVVNAVASELDAAEARRRIAAG